MKVLKLVFAVLTGLYAVAQAVVLILMLTGVRAHSRDALMASGGLLCAALGISLALFKSALKAKDGPPGGAVQFTPKT
jgi:hypothetical protein